MKYYLKKYLIIIIDIKYQIVQNFFIKFYFSFFIKNQYIKDYNKSKYLTLTPVYEKRSQLLLKCKISTI